MVIELKNMGHYKAIGDALASPKARLIVLMYNTDAYSCSCSCCDPNSMDLTLSRLQLREQETYLLTLLDVITFN